MMRATCRSACLLILLLFGSCGGENIPEGRTLVRNDILDKDYNEVIVDQISTKAANVSFRRVLKPGERVLLPGKGITKMRFSRKYADHTNLYLVNCPGQFTAGVLIKLIDVHTGRMQGGCVLEKKGTLTQTGIRWDKGRS